MYTKQHLRYAEKCSKSQACGTPDLQVRPWGFRGEGKGCGLFDGQCGMMVRAGTRWKHADPAPRARSHRWWRCRTARGASPRRFCCPRPTAAWTWTHWWAPPPPTLLYGSSGRTGCGLARCDDHALPHATPWHCVCETSRKAHPCAPSFGLPTCKRGGFGTVWKR